MAIFSASVGISDIFDGADAYTPYLTNEAEVVPADNAGSVAASTTVTGNFKVLLGTYDITSSSVFSVVSAAGISISNVSINTSGLYTIDVAGTALSLSSSIVLRAAHNGTSFDLNLSITRSDAAVNGSSASGIRLTSDRQTFSFSNSASGTVSSDGDITLTVDRQNMSGTTVWTVVNNKGSVPTLGVTTVNGTDTATVTAAAFGDNGGSGANDQVLFVKITSTAGGLSDTVTIHKIRQGDNVAVSKVGTTASVVSSNGDTVTLDDGVNGDSFKQFTVYKAATTSGNAGTPSNTGVVIANDGSMTTPPSGWSQSRPTPTVYEIIYASDATFKRTASTGSYALEQTWTAASAVSGVGGARGSRSFFIEVATLNAASSQGSALATSKSTSNPWQSSSALSATATQGLRVTDWVKNYSDGQDGTIVTLDTVTVYNVTNQWSATRFYTGSQWASVEEVIDGNLLVQGTIGTDKIVANAITVDLIASLAITADKIAANAITSDKIVMDGNIEFANTQSGVQFGKTSLGDSQAGAFFGRSGGVAGFNISSSTSGIYADSAGQVALNNVRLYTGSAGSAAEFPNPGTFTLNISSISTSISVIIIGGGGGSSNNASGTLSGGLSGYSGTASWLKWYSGLNGSGSVLATYTAAGGAGLTRYQVASNISPAGGAAGMPSSKAAGGAGGAGNGGAPSSGTFGSGGGGGGGTSGSGNTGNAPVTGRAGAGATVSQLVSKPSGAQSVKLFVGTGGAGGAGQSMHYNNNSGNWTGFSLVAGGNGGNGFVSVADPNSGGIEVDLLSIVNRLTAAGI